MQHKINKRDLLKLLAIKGFVTIVTTEITACASEPLKSNAEEQDRKILINLGLLDENSNGMQEASIAIENQLVKYKINSSINASLLLDQNNKAKDQASYDFIINTLQVSAIGKKFEDATFDRDALNDSKGEVTEIKPILTPTTNKTDYAVTGGNFSFQFQKNEQKLGKVYIVNIKIAPEKGILADLLAKIVPNIKFDDTNLATKAFKFLPDANASNLPTKVTITNKEHLFYKLHQFLKEDGIEINVKTKFNSIQTKLKKTDKIELIYSAGEVNFDQNIIKTEVVIDEGAYLGNLIGLLDEYGISKEKVYYSQNEYIFDIPIITDVRGLLDSSNKAKDLFCYNYITKVLSIKPKEGTKFEDATFDRNTLDAIKCNTIFDEKEMIKPDGWSKITFYKIKSGKFSFYFEKDGKKISQEYKGEIKKPDRFDNVLPE